MELEDIIKEHKELVGVNMSQGRTGMSVLHHETAKYLEKLSDMQITMIGWVNQR